jgi:hypothetical protein
MKSNAGENHDEDEIGLYDHIYDSSSDDDGGVKRKKSKKKSKKKVKKLKEDIESLSEIGEVEDETDNLSFTKMATLRNKQLNRSKRAKFQSRLNRSNFPNIDITRMNTMKHQETMKSGKIPEIHKKPKLTKE